MPGNKIVAVTGHSGFSWHTGHPPLRRHETNIPGAANAMRAFSGMTFMRVNPVMAGRSWRALLMGLLGFACVGAGNGRAEDRVRQPTAIQFSFDRPIDASAAPFVLAAADGLFGSEGLAVTTNIANGSPDAIARVATGSSDLALVDINALIRFHHKAAAPPVKAVFVLFNAAPYAIVARKSRGIRALSDIEGKTLGVAEGDLSIRLWPALARRNGIKPATVKQERIGAAVREPMLSAGQVDAVSGFSYLSAVNLRDRGVPADDLAVLRYADYGCEAYGFAVIVNPAFAAAKPEAVKGFLRAVIAGTHATIQDPARATDEVVSRMEDGSRDLELERLRIVIRDNILTGEVHRNGIGGIDPARLDRSIDQIAEGFEFQKRPSAADIFDDAFLPPLGDRLIN
jgi:NitT/TauT family transport system substrate-binding protein